MSTLKLAKSITVLGDGKLSIFLFDNTEVYLQPTIIVNTLDSLQRLKIRDSVNYVDIETSIEEIGGSPFGGTFPQLETAIRELAKSANSINYGSGSPHDLSLLGTAPNHWWRTGDGDTYPTISDNIGSVDFTMINMTAADIVNDVPV
jgi:hypothetical protein